MFHCLVAKSNSVITASILCPQGNFKEEAKGIKPVRWLAVCEPVDTPVTCVSCVVDVPGSNPGQHPPSFFHFSDYGVNIVEYPGGRSKKAVCFPSHGSPIISRLKIGGRFKKKKNLIRLLNIIFPVNAVKYKLKT
jgi:hypothetical protein